MLHLVAMTDKAFANVLRELRLKKGFSQETFAFEVGIHRTYVSQLERGLKSPSLKTIQKIGRVLDVTLSELMSLVEIEMNKESSSSVQTDRD
ncbi:MAG: helix-turn-helix transcriptional regulator [Chloroflexi bacterium]|nr:helix-turn-helix transcriptional regulator [Chloroflexota bacterium]